MAAASSSDSGVDLYLLEAEDSGDDRLHKLASQLGLPLLSPAEAGGRQGLYLTLHEGRLALGELGGPQHPVSVDFSTALARRRQGPELLLKAIGGGLPRPSVVDATAGLGRDSAVLLALGFPVTMIERNAVVAALLADAVTRLSAQSDELAARLSLHCGCAEALLPELQALGAADVVYLDPMFAASAKSALVKKDMQWFQRLLGHGEDDAALLDAALAHARYRVVVKRAAKAPALANRKPSFAVSGKAVRFDVYALKAFKSGASGK